VTRFGDRTPEKKIGLANLADDIPISEYPDIETRSFCQTIRDQRGTESSRTGTPIDMSDVEREIRLKARDHGRIPIPWDAREANAGCSDTMSALWTPMNSDAEACNVAAQDKRPDSVLNYWRKMLAFRKQHPDTLVFGDFEPLAVDDSPVFAYWRRDGKANGSNDVLVILNMTSKSDVSFILPGDGTFTILQTTNASAPAKAAPDFKGGQEIPLSAYEGLVIEYSAS
jgi:oligo-1,6-glucosidase